MLARPFNPSTWEVEAGTSLRVQGQPAGCSVHSKGDRETVSYWLHEVGVEGSVVGGVHAPEFRFACAKLLRFSLLSSSAARISKALPLFQQRISRYSPNKPWFLDDEQTASRQIQYSVLPWQKEETQEGRAPLRPL